MKLELSVNEVETILLEWAEQKWPGQFNRVELKRERYSDEVSTCKFTKEDTHQKAAE